MARVPGLPTDEVVIVVGSRAPTVWPFLHLMPVSQVGNPAQDAVGCWSSEELESMGVGEAMDYNFSYQEAIKRHIKNKFTTLFTKLFFSL